MATLRFLSLLSQPEFLPCQAFNWTKAADINERHPCTSCVGGGYLALAQVLGIGFVFFFNVLLENNCYVVEKEQSHVLVSTNS